MDDSPFALHGVRVAVPPCGWIEFADPPAWVPGVIVLDLGGPPGCEVVGVEIPAGGGHPARVVFRWLRDCRLIP